jgi:hypothetical protein
LGFYPINLTSQIKEGQQQQHIYPVAFVRYKENILPVMLYQGKTKAITYPEINSAEAMMEFNFATSNKVRYRIMIEGVRHDKIIDQLAHSNEWVSLGVYKFNGRNQGKEYIVAYDNTRESLNSTMIAFDALMLVPQERR